MAKKVTPPPGKTPAPPPTEPDGSDTSRRRFLTVVGAGAVAAGAAGVWYSTRPGPQHHHPDAGPEVPDGGMAPAPMPAEFLTYDEHEFRTLDAIAGVLLPADEDPGARESGAMIFIDREMRRPAFQSAARRLKVGVKAFDFLSRQKLHKDFVELPGADQEAIVRAIFDGEADRGSFKGRAFMVVMLSLVLEGHMSDPSHGGNRDGVGWALVGFEPMAAHPPGGHSGGHHGHG